MARPIIYFVLPCYNEAECLEKTFESLDNKYRELFDAKKISDKSKIVFVDDGSKDETWQIIEKLSEDKKVVGVKLAHNVGHQNALFAGLMYASKNADASISMDADLQDDIGVIDGFLEKFEQGYEVVYGVRGSRKKDTVFKRCTAQGFYKIMKALGVELVYNAADCRLMSKRAMECLSEYTETNLFLRGVVPSIGLKSTTVEYERNKRFAGKSKYPLKKMLSFAWEGITSFSIKPIQLVKSIGILLSIASLAIIIYAIVRWATGQTVSGWTFTICSIWLLAGIQVLAIGIVGEYIGKIYAETKRRPRYFIEKITGKE